MTATDELRRLLDERGVEYLASEDSTTIYYADSGYRYTYNVNHDSGWAQLYGYNLTPAQVIAATLGAVKLEKAKAKRMPNMWGFSSYYCGCCGHKLAEVANGLNEHFPNYCESCGTKAVYE